MSGIQIFPDPKAVTPRLLLSPSTLLVLSSNLIPLAGVAYWSWDAFLVLMFFWLETAIIAFWTMARILALPPGAGTIEMSNGARMASRIAMVVFYTLHSGIFMTVHFVFLWALFSGGWRAAVHGPGDFVDRIVIASGLWLPLAFSFLGRGIAVVLESARSGQAEGSGRRFVPGDAGAPAATRMEMGAVIGGLYGRIVIMHLVILAGAWLTQVMGTLAPFLLLIGLKTFFDVLFHVTMDLQGGRKNPSPAPDKPGRAKV